MASEAAAFGGISGSFDGTGDYIYTPDGAAVFTPGIDEDFTICGWVTPSDSNTVRGFVTTLTSSGQTYGWQLYHDSFGKVIFQGRDITTDNQYWVFGGTVTTSSRAYIALCKKGRVWRIYVDGVPGDPVTINVAINNLAGTHLYYGRFSTYHPSYEYSGKLDDWRIYRGLCLYQNNFTPPTEGFVDR